MFSFVIPGRRAAASPELITTGPSVSDYYVYLLASRKHGTLYVGVTNDLVLIHATKAAPGFTSRYGVDRLVWFECFEDPMAAIEREKDIKKWRRELKIRLIEGSNPEWIDLYDGIARGG